MKHKLPLAAAAILILILIITLILPESRVAANYNSGFYKFIIDAGHGGADGGAVGPDGTVESTLNLSICLKLDAVLGLFGYSSVLTRDSEDINYPESANTIHKKKVYDQNSRIALINSVENGILISIHLNKYPSAQPCGAQVLYSKSNFSRELAECMQSLLIGALKDGNRRAAAQIPGDIYLMKKVLCPAVLVECGFMSNPDEFALLKTDTYKTKLAVIIAASCVKCCQNAVQQYEQS